MARKSKKGLRSKQKQAQNARVDAKPAAKREPTQLEEALDVKRIAYEGLQICDLEQRPKFVDAHARASNTVRQLHKDRKKDLASFSDDEIVDHIKALPERRREVIVTAVQGASLAETPIFP